VVERHEGSNGMKWHNQPARRRMESAMSISKNGMAYAPVSPSPSPPRLSAGTSFINEANGALKTNAFSTSQSSIAIVNDNGVPTEREREREIREAIHTISMGTSTSKEEDQVGRDTKSIGHDSHEQSKQQRAQSRSGGQRERAQERRAMKKWLEMRQIAGGNGISAIAHVSLLPQTTPVRLAQRSILDSGGAERKAWRGGGVEIE
jgi:hypothetical protein